MEERLQQKTIGDYLDALRRRKLGLAITLIVIFAVAASVAFLLPSVYRSKAVILIEQQDIPSDLVQSTVTSFADERIQIISQRVMTTTNLTRIMNKYDLYKDERESDTREEIIAYMRDDISLNLISAEVIDPRSGRPTQATIAFELSYRNESPELAQKVTNELVSLYLNENLKSRTEKAAEAVKFLNSEAQKVSNKIGELETELARFKENNAGSLPELTDLNLTLMERTEREMLELDRQIRSLEERKIYLESELDQMDPSAAVYTELGERILTPHGRLKALQSQYVSLLAQYSADHPDVKRMRNELEALRTEVGEAPAARQDLDRRLEGLRGELAAAKENYAPEHPDVQRLQRQIAELEQARKDTPAAASEETVKADNPAYIALKARLEAVNSDLRSYEAKHAKLTNKLANYEERIVRSPQVERKYRALVREHQNAVAKHREIVDKQMAAQLGEELEKDSKGERFSLIEPPLKSEKPVSPNRKAILILGFILALGGGLGMVLLRESLDQSIRGEKAVANMLGLNPLATIPYIVTEAEQRRKRRNGVLALTALVLGLVLALVSIHYIYKPLDVLWFVALRKLGL